MKRWTPAFAEELRRRHYPGQMALPGAFGENSDLSDRPSRSVPVTDQTLGAVMEARAAMLAAKQRFIDSVYGAVDAGYSNMAIGGAASMTEAGIRQILRRNNRPSAPPAPLSVFDNRNYGTHADCGGNWIRYRPEPDSALSPGLLCDRCFKRQDFREVAGVPVVSAVQLTTP